MENVPDNSIIESQSINVLKSALQRCHRLKPLINENDKTVSWDGNVEVYNSERFSKATLAGVVSVQVKGKWVTELPKTNAIKYSASIGDLKNYLKSNGAIFFVICCNDDGGKVYYNSLLPFDLYILLKDVSPLAATKTIDLQELSQKNPMDAYGIFRDFLYHSKRQAQLDTNMIERFSTGELDSKSIPLSFGYGGIPARGDREAINYILSHPTYIYTQPSGFNIDIALGKMQIAAIERESDKPIIVNDEVLYDGITTLYDDSGNEEIHIGNHIIVSLRKRKITITFSDKLSERLRDLKFMQYLVINKPDIQPDTPLFETSNGESISLNNIRAMIKFYQDLQNALNVYGVKKDFLFCEAKDNDWGKIQAFIEATNYNKEVPYSFGGDPGIGMLEFANIKLFICCLRGENGKFKIRNPFSMPEMGVRYELDELEKTFWASPYFEALKHDRLSIIDNLNTSAIKDSILKFQDNSDIYTEQLTRYILEILLAYDNNLNSALLKLADELQEELDRLKWDGIPGVSAIVNRLQINKRKGQSITASEVDTLLKIKATYSSDNLVLACCCILLQNFQEADYYIGKMTMKELEEFKSFPINNLKK